MLDSIRIGRYIAILRKQKGMTQDRLADQMRVSHQAVSSWERGQTMPDIGMLSGLAHALGTSVDILLRAGEKDEEIPEKVPENAGNRKEENKEEAISMSENTHWKDALRSAFGRHAENRPEGAEALQEEKPFVKREQDAAAAAPEQTVSQKAGASTVVSVPTAAPFPSPRITQEARRRALETAIRKLEEEQERLEEELEEAEEEEDEKTEAYGEKAFSGGTDAEDNDDAEDETENDVENEAENDDPDDVEDEFRERQEHLSSHGGSKKTKDRWEKILAFAPFVGRETLDRMVRSLEDTPDFNRVAELAPFLSSETIDELIGKAINDGNNAGWDRIVCLAPFAGRETLDRMVRSLEDTPDFNRVAELAPFLCQDTVNELIREATAAGEPANMESVLCLAPFASSQMLDSLVEELLKNEEEGEEAAEKAAPDGQQPYLHL